MLPFPWGPETMHALQGRTAGHLCCSRPGTHTYIHTYIHTHTVHTYIHTVHTNIYTHTELRCTSFEQHIYSLSITIIACMHTYIHTVHTYLAVSSGVSGILPSVQFSGLFENHRRVHPQPIAAPTYIHTYIHTYT